MAFEMIAGPKILVHGHRGARAVRPENTLPAFEYALAQGVDALEMDLAVTKDNVLVVSHDPAMNPRICTGPANSPQVIREMTLAQLKQWDCGAKQNPDFPRQTAIAGTKVPTFDEVLELAKPTQVEFNVETKIFLARPELTPTPEAFARMVIEAVKKQGMESRLILQSFDWRTLEAAKRIGPGIRLSALYSSTLNDGAVLKDYVGDANAAGYPIVSPIHRLISKADVDRAHSFGMKVVPWTANDAAAWDKLIEVGVDAIITDDPAALIAHLKAKGLR